MKEVLNHSSLAVTEVYARLNLAPVRDALEFNATQMLMLEHGAQVTPQPNPKPRLADGSRAEMD